MTPQFKEALIRAVLVAVASGVGAAAGILATAADWRSVAAAGLGAAAAAFLARFAGEGAFDSGRAQRGAIKPADVGWAIAMGDQRPGQSVGAPPTDPAEWGVNQREGGS